MNEKEVIKKLLKIAENQQKIITKLAQSTMPQNERTDSFKKTLLAFLKQVYPAMQVSGLEIEDAGQNKLNIVMSAEHLPDMNSLRTSIYNSVGSTGNELQKLTINDVDVGK